MMLALWRPESLRIGHWKLYGDMHQPLCRQKPWWPAQAQGQSDACRHPLYLTIAKFCWLSAWLLVQTLQAEHANPMHQDLRLQTFLETRLRPERYQKAQPSQRASDAERRAPALLFSFASKFCLPPCVYTKVAVTARQPDEHAQRQTPALLQLQKISLMTSAGLRVKALQASNDSQLQTGPGCQ